LRSNDITSTIGLLFSNDITSTIDLLFSNDITSTIDLLFSNDVVLFVATACTHLTILPSRTCENGSHHNTRLSLVDLQ
jgi:hypothetical protein